jgi:hypothetical protein
MTTTTARRRYYDACGRAARVAETLAAKGNDEIVAAMITSIDVGVGASFAFDTSDAAFKRATEIIDLAIKRTEQEVGLMTTSVNATDAEGGDDGQGRNEKGA